MKWIPVDERLPDHENDPTHQSLGKISYDRPLCCLITDGENIAFGYYSLEDYHPQPGWQVMFSNEHSEIESEPAGFTVTHWMEIPVPPMPGRDARGDEMEKITSAKECVGCGEIYGYLGHMTHSPSDCGWAGQSRKIAIIIDEEGRITRKEAP